MLRSIRLLVLLACVLLAGPLYAQDALLAPDAFLGYELGTRFTPHHRVVDYVEHVAAHSPRVRLERYGETYEGRPLLLAYVSSPGQLTRLEAIREDNLRRAGLLPGEPAGAAPAIVWLSYNVHGNESVSTEAAMQTLFELADPGNTRTGAWLEEAVVIIDPAVNPDGRDRYVHWYQQMRGTTPNPAPAAREHHEPWPGGRTNHYYFDLNRDWAWMVQQETQQRIPHYNRWMPHVHVDFHEQGVDEPYYFAPAAEPFHDDVTPWQREFQTTIGRNHARYFDEAGWLYFTRERFDLLYPGYGDTWPTFNGGIGMTYEQGGSGRAGLAIRTADGDTLTLADRILHHHTTGLSTVEATARDRARVVAEFEQFFERSRTSPPGPYRTYVLKTSGRPDVRRAIADHLAAQGIAFGFAGQTRTVRGFGFRSGETGQARIEGGDLVVTAYQPKSVLAKVLLEPRTVLADTLTYDITAWALPYAYGIDAIALEERVAPDTDAAPAPPTPVAGTARPYAYLADWKSLQDVRLLSSLLSEGIRVRYAGQAFEAAGRTFDPGTLIVTRADNEHLGERFDGLVREAGQRLEQPLYPVASGFVTRGADFGSSDVRHLARPRVALLAGEPTSSYALGEVWHFFDRQIDYPVTLVNARDFDLAALDDVDVLILPNGSYDGWLTDTMAADLRSWVRSGGRLVALEGAVSALAGKEGFAVRPKKGDDAGGDTPADSLEARLRSYGERERRAISEEVPGSVYRVRMDPSHPLAFGYTDTYFTLKRGDAAFTFLKDGWNVGVIRGDAPESGFAGSVARAKLKDSLTFGVQGIGRGEVVYLVDNPLFRGFWYGGKLLFSNAVFLVGQ